MDKREHINSLMLCVKEAIEKTLGDINNDLINNEDDWKFRFYSYFRDTPFLIKNNLIPYPELRVPNANINKKNNLRVDVGIWDSEKSEPACLIELKFGRRDSKEVAESDYSKLAHLKDKYKELLVVALSWDKKRKRLYIQSNCLENTELLPNSSNSMEKHAHSAKSYTHKQFRCAVIESLEYNPKVLYPHRQTEKKYIQWHEALWSAELQYLLTNKYVDIKISNEVPIKNLWLDGNGKLDLKVKDSKGGQVTGCELKVHGEMSRSKRFPEFLDRNEEQKFCDKFEELWKEYKKTKLENNKKDKIVKRKSGLYPKDKNGISFFNDHFVTKLLELREQYQRLRILVEDKECNINFGYVIFCDIAYYNIDSLEKEAAINYFKSRSKLVEKLVCGDNNSQNMEWVYAVKISRNNGSALTLLEI